jgi:SAM-dependent methyltransferase
MNLKKQISLQVQSNNTVNLLAALDINGFGFTENIKNIIKQIAQGVYDEANKKLLAQHSAQMALSSFYAVNQFYTFDRNAINALEELYVELLKDISHQSADAINYSFLERQHFYRLQQWLLQFYPDAALLYPVDKPFIEKPVVCAEYMAALQLEVLGIKEEALIGPVLDIGCGKEQYLVKHLQKKGIETFGLDREATPSATAFQQSWLEFDYKPRYWGTIISHLGFSNHFLHQHLRQNGLFLPYAGTYMKILYSLQSGGRFYYTPHLPFIEIYLDPGEFTVETLPVEGTTFHATVITRVV